MAGISDGGGGRILPIAALLPAPLRRLHEPAGQDCSVQEENDEVLGALCKAVPSASLVIWT